MEWIGGGGGQSSGQHHRLWAELRVAHADSGNVLSVDMPEFAPENIVAYRFTRRRRKGYDTLQVDGYLRRLAEHLGRMEAEITRLQATERAALDTLQQAQLVSAETVAAAERDAEQLRQNATDGLQNARRDTLTTMDTARAQADKTLLAAQAQAEAAVEARRLQISELEAAGVERTKQFDAIVEELRQSATTSAADLRSAGARLVEMAEHFEFQLATVGEVVDTPDDVAAESTDATINTYAAPIEAGDDRAEIN